MKLYAAYPLLWRRVGSPWRGARALDRPFTRVACLLLALAVCGCAQAQRQSGAYGSTHTHRSHLPPEKAASCFGRNAEEHSSALVSAVSGGDVTVRVKNGVTYATAAYRRAGAGSMGSITLNVTTSGRRSDLFDALVEGC